MNLAAHPELLDRVAAAYALGTLRNGARRRFETLARQQPVVQAAAIVWQSRLAGLTELQPGAEPDAAVWTRIDNLVHADLEQRAMREQRSGATKTAAARPSSARGSGWGGLLLWRTVAAGGVLAAVFAFQHAVQLREHYAATVAALQGRLQSMPVVEYVAVLNNDSAHASVLVTFDPNNRRLTLKRVDGTQVAADKSLQLWALPPGQAPRSLGVLEDARVQRIPASPDEVNNVPALAISLEPLGGVPSERGPTGPVLYKGALLQTAS